jgi:gamma-glutamylcyclotransferase (GGCT)/AIG2-like uncharacterized protein YtfP
MTTREDTKKTRAVFVYGTLLKGEGNHRVLRDSRLIGLGITKPAFELHDLGPFPGETDEELAKSLVTEMVRAGLARLHGANS